ncbi:MAG: hypothetical protein DRJ07_11005 [Bacteroidetes bacterium]|nr:MAG: hypothetical protein DRJ07_11005 [Bacteroidota bacterium]
MKIYYDASNQIIIVTKSGLASVSDIIELINEAVSLGDKKNCCKFLFNMQNAIETGTFNELYEFHKNLTQVTNLTYDHRCAVIFSQKADKRRKLFYETISSNWGQGIFKIFFELEEGLIWLKRNK